MKIAIVGAGPAGIEAAHILATNNCQVTLFEKNEQPLANLRDKAFLFPDFSSAESLISELETKITHPNIQLLCNKEIVKIDKSAADFQLSDTEGVMYKVDKVLIATGYRLFEARRKEELGYGIYKGVLTSLDMEKMLKEQKVVNSMGEIPQKIAFLQCVGSRDEKSGNNYCSKVCCVTAIKQAIEIRKLLTHSDIYIFYMDLRMWGQGFEELYRTAQEKYDIRFIRGRISEASSTFDGKVQIKSEDTLIGQPLKMTTDLLVLMAGMEPSDGTHTLADYCHISGAYHFIESNGPHLQDNKTNMPGVFVAGTAKRPMSIRDSVTDAAAAAFTILNE